MAECVCGYVCVSVCCFDCVYVVVCCVMFEAYFVLVVDRDGVFCVVCCVFCVLFCVVVVSVVCASDLCCFVRACNCYVGVFVFVSCCFVLIVLCFVLCQVA